MKDLITGITKQLKIVSSKVHYLHIPDDNAALEDHSIVFTVTNSENGSVIENPEVLKSYECQVNINSAKIKAKLTLSDEATRVLNLYQPLKNAMYALPVSYIKCTFEDFFFDSNLEVYTQVLIFQIQN